MLRLFKQVFILFLSFSSSLARELTKLLSLNEKQCIVRPALIDLNPLEKCQCECKNYRNCKKDYSWHSGTCICENSKYFKSIAYTSVIKCDEILTVMDIVSTKFTNTIATNVTGTASINCRSKTVKYFISYTVLLVIILIMKIFIIFYYYAKQKGINALEI